MKISKKAAKILNIVLIAIMLLCMVSNFAFAAEFKHAEVKPTTTDASNKVGDILGIAQTVGYAVAIIMLVVLAIKYISSSPNDKAEIKKHAVIYIVGAVVLFAASGLVGLIKDWSINAIK